MSKKKDKNLLTQASKDRKAVFARYGKRPSYSLTERSIRYGLRGLALLTVGITFAILIVLLKDALVFFDKVSIVEFFTETRWEPFGEPKILGVMPLIAGTLMVSLGAIVVAVPLGLGTAVYLTQYADSKTADILGPIVEILGGVPTVVYGFFALTAVTPFLQYFFPSIETFNALSASIVVGIAILPMIASISADALRQVPISIKNGGYALGMRKINVIIKIIIPAAYSGIVSSVILAFARAIGETMAVTLAAGATPNLDFNYFKGIQTITAFIVQISLGDTPAGSIEYYTIYALGLTLFVVTLGFNMLAQRIVQKYQEQYE